MRRFRTRQVVVALALLLLTPSQALAQGLWQQAEGGSPWIGWAWIISIIVIVVAVVVWGALIRRQQRRIQREFRLQIANLGNAPSSYQIQVLAPAHALEFEFFLRGSSLQGEGPSPAPPAAVSRTAAPQGADPAPRSAPAAPASGLKQAKGKAMGAGGAVAGLLGQLGMILPRSIGAPLLQTSARIRHGQSSVHRVEQLPQRTARLRPKIKPPSTPAQPSRPASKSDATLPAPGAAAAVTVVPTLVETPPLQPGQSLEVALLVQPADIYQTKRYTFAVTSRPVEQPEAEPLRQETEIQIAGFTPLERFAPFLVVLIVAMVAIVLAFALVAGAS